MIKSIMGGKHVNIVNGSFSPMYLNAYSGAPGIGNMRYSPSTQNIEVYDGNSWISMPTNYTTVELTPDAQQAIDWAKEERARHLQYEELAKKHPAVADAIESLKDAELKLRELAILCTEDSK